MKKPRKITNDMKNDALMALDRWRYLNEPFVVSDSAETAALIRQASKMDPRVFDELSIILDVKPDIVQNFWQYGIEMPHKIVQETIVGWIEKEYLSFEVEKQDESVGTNEQRT